MNANEIYVCEECGAEYEYRPRVCIGCGSDYRWFFPLQEPTQEDMGDYLHVNPLTGEDRRLREEETNEKAIERFWSIADAEGLGLNERLKSALA